MSASLHCRIERLAHRYDLSVGRLIVVEVQASRTRDSALLAATLTGRGSARNHGRNHILNGAGSTAATWTHRRPARANASR